ncbi:hypothetical protein [Moraxella cuniculi]|uniref:Uncharacterized protein n=1 Tax=Moraxella cuniculi TaxID=34061 RepID=A0A448GVP2_9GAMM|nr:hypothetical protein [Moraxella cuniculi]VEG12779.1 Uncharacterised protein [Moraxella cuniculi]
MRELSLKEIEMVSGGMRDNFTNGGNMGGGRIADSIAVGALSNMAGYSADKLASGESPTQQGMIISAFMGGFTGFFGGPIQSGKQAINIIGSNAAAGAAGSGLSRIGRTNSQQAGTDYQNTSQAGTNYQ